MNFSSDVKNRRLFNPLIIKGFIQYSLVKLKRLHFNAPTGFIPRTARFRNMRWTHVSKKLAASSRREFRLFMAAVGEGVF